MARLHVTWLLTLQAVISCLLGCASSPVTLQLPSSALTASSSDGTLIAEIPVVTVPESAYSSKIKPLTQPSTPMSPALQREVDNEEVSTDVQRRLGERDDSQHCQKNSFKQVSISILMASNLPDLPEGTNSEVYTLIKWDDDSRTANGNGTHRHYKVTPASKVSSADEADFDSGVWYDFQNPCGEDSLVFQLWEKDGSSARGNRDDDSLNDDEKDDIIWKYQSRTNIAELYDSYGVDKTCWYVQTSYDDDDADDDLIDGTPVTKTDVYFRWCVKVKCTSGYSCYLAIPEWAWLFVLTLFLLPTVLCGCCVCCMSRQGSREVVQVRRRQRIATQRRSLRMRAWRRLSRIRFFRVHTQDSPDIDYDDEEEPEIELQPIHQLRTLSFCEIEHQQFEDETCAVCLGEFNPDHKVKRLPCGHIFHADCIDEWGAQSPCCPLCKTDVRVVKYSGRSAEL